MNDSKPSRAQLIAEVRLLRQQLADARLAEETLRQSEARFRALYENSEDAILLTAPDGRIFAANPAACHIFGRSEIEICQGGRSLLLDANNPGLAEVLAERARTGRARGELIYRRRDGTPFPGEFTSVVFQGPNAEPRTSMIVRDITKRRQVEDALRQSEANLQALMNAADETIILMETDGTILELNDLAAERMNSSAAQMRGRNIAGFLPPETASGRQTFFDRAIQTKLPVQFEYERLGRLMVSRLYPVLDDNGQVIRLAAFSRDITDLKQIAVAEREQRVMAESLRDTAAALNSSLKIEDVLDRILEFTGRVVPHNADAIAILLIDDESKMVYPARYRSTHPNDRGMENKNVTFIIAETRNLREMIATGAPVIIADTSAYEGWVYKPENAWIRANLGVPILIKGEPIGFLVLDSASPAVFTAQDAEHLRAFVDQAATAIENARLYAEVQELAVTDALTGLLNQRGLIQLGEREVERALRFQHPLSMVMIDIDHFKLVNDTFGHPSGDRVLRALALACRAQVRTVDVVARYGGEEFILLLPETDIARAAQVAERLRRSMEELTLPADPDGEGAGETLQVTVSLGVVRLTPDAPTLASLLSRVDQALYQAKQDGRNRIAIAD